MRFLCLVSWVGIYWLTVASGVMAQEVAPANKNGLEYVPPVTMDAPGAGYLLVRLVGLTLFVLTLCIGLMWFARRQAKTSKPGEKSGEMEFVATLPLDARTSLHLLKAGNKPVVVGTDAGGIQQMLVLPESFEQVLQQMTVVKNTP